MPHSVFRQIEIFKICLKCVLCQKTPTLSFGEQRGERTFASHFQKTTITLNFYLPNETKECLDI